MNTTVEIVPVAQQQDLATMFGYIAHSLTESSMAMYKRDFTACMDYAEKQELHPQDEAYQHYPNQQRTDESISECAR